MNNQFDKILEASFNEIFNQCDGCIQGLRFNSFNVHVDSRGVPVMNCQKHKYNNSGFYRVDEDHKITRIRKRDVEIHQIVKE